jgi:acetyl esterase/lipase
MLVAAGGGYKRIEIESEALPAAQWLAERGITAFVLSYRLPPEGWRMGPLAPLQDAQRAIRWIRANAARYRVDEAKIGVLGFSAGGHLMGLTATRPDFAAYEPVDSSDKKSAKPDMAALIYPVVTLEPPYDHTSTRRSLIGDHPSASDSAQWSVETHVRSGCPPMFLVQASDDDASNPANTQILTEACKRADVAVEYHLLSSGGHGFGMGRAGSPTEQWPRWFEAWLRQNRMLT